MTCTLPNNFLSSTIVQRDKLVKKRCGIYHFLPMVVSYALTEKEGYRRDGMRGGIRETDVEE